MKRNILIIDDNDQSEEIEDIVHRASTKGITLRCLQYNVGSPSERGVLKDGLIDTDKVVSVYKTKFYKEEFNLIACDYDLNDENTNGVELLRKLAASKIGIHTPKMIYSGKLDTILRQSFEAVEQNRNKKDTIVKQLKALINMGLIGCCDRGEDMKNLIVNYLTSCKESPYLILEQILSENADCIFLGGDKFSKYSNMKFSEIKEKFMIENELEEDFLKKVISIGLGLLTKEFK